METNRIRPQPVLHEYTGVAQIPEQCVEVTTVSTLQPCLWEAIHLLCIPLRPLFKYLAHNLAGLQLWDFFHKLDSSHELFMFRHLCLHMRMDVFSRGFSLELIFESHIRSWPFLSIEGDPDSSSIGDRIKLQKHSLELCRSNLKGVDFDEFLAVMNIMKVARRGIMLTFFRSTIQNQPFFITATSPVFSQPSGDNDSFVASSFLQYPRQMLGPRT
jgi:hypothetical protein